MQGGTPNELLARIALANGPAIIQRNLAILRSNLELVVEFFSRHHQRFEFVKPRVGTVCFPRLTAKGDEAEGYCTALAEEHSLTLIPPSAMAPPDVTAALAERLGQRFRLGFGRESLPGLLPRWSSAVEAEEAEEARVGVAATADARL